MKWPSIGGTALNWVIQAFANRNIVKDFSPNSAEYLGEVLVDFLLCWAHALARFVQGFLGSVELFDVDFSPGTGNHRCGIAERFLRIEFAFKFIFDFTGLNQSDSHTGTGTHAGH